MKLLNKLIVWKTIILILVVFLYSADMSGQTGEEITNAFKLEEMSLEDLLKVEVGYGFEKSPVQVHVFLNTAYWNFEHQALGPYANEGSKSLAGYPFFISYSGYISTSCQINENLFAEAEFELYKGQKGQFKVCRLRQVWTPSRYIRITLGRDFPPIGIPEEIYYPPSRFRLFALTPHLYWSVSHLTGWWDSGIIATFKFPIFEDGEIKIDSFIINGPGDKHLSYNIETKIKPNQEGYMYEYFVDKARQPWDNNKSKHIGGRITISLFKNLEIGFSYADGKYDRNDKYNATFAFGFLTYTSKRLTIVGEYGQLALGVPTENMMVSNVNNLNGTWGDDKVTQYSYYISAGYKVIQNSFINYLEPVVRYEYLDPWKEDSKNKGDRHIIWAGFRLSPYKYWILKAGYMWQIEPYGPRLSNNGTIIESVMEF